MLEFARSLRNVLPQIPLCLHLLNGNIDSGLEQPGDEIGNKDGKVDLINPIRCNETQTRASAAS